MEIGASPAGPVEEILRRSRIDLAISRRQPIDLSWHYDLQSPFWRLYVNNRSGASIIHAGRRLSLRPDRLYVIPAWVHFQTETVRPLTQDFIHFYVTGFPPSLLRQVFDQPRRLSSDPALDSLSRRWRHGFREPPSFATLGWASALAQAAVAFVMENLPAAGREACFRSLTDASEIGPALESIDRNLSHPPVNAALARLCGLSVDHFIRRFRHLVGLTPAQYGLERRVSLAAQWLTASPRSVDQIAEEAGFTDRFHFSRVFKARLGLPPAAYRRMHRMEVAPPSAGKR